MIHKEYYPNKPLKIGLKIWREMFQELFEARELIWRLFIRDFSVKYRQSFLGYLWAVILPLITIGAFVYLQRSGVLNIGQTDVPYPLFALLGLTVWQIFTTGLNSGVGSLVAAGGMITKINFPRETLIIASLAQTCFDFLIKTVLVVLICFYYRFVPHTAIFLVPFVLAPLFAFTLAWSLLLSMINAVLRDTAHMVMLLTSFLLFLTPVLYPLESHNRLLFKCNPLTALVNAPRDLIIYGYIQDVFSFTLVSGLSFLFLLIAWRIFHLVETKIPERI